MYVDGCCHFFYHKYTQFDNGPPTWGLLNSYENAKINRCGLGSANSSVANPGNENVEELVASHLNPRTWEPEAGRVLMGNPGQLNSRMVSFPPTSVGCV